MGLIAYGKSLAWLLLFVLPLAALADSFSLEGIELSTQKPWGSDTEWRQIAIELRYDARDEALPPAAVMSLTLAFQVDQARIQFFSRSVRFIAPDVGEKRTVFFFLPPEIASRNAFSREPLAWAIRLDCGDEPPVLAQSELLSDPAALTSFQRQAQTANRDYLLPLYATPFALYPHEEYRRASPTYLWKESAQ